METGCDRTDGGAELAFWALLPSACPALGGCTVLDAVGVEYKNFPAIKVVRVQIATFDTCIDRYWGVIGVDRARNSKARFPID